MGSMPRSGRSPGGGHGTPVFLPGESHGQRSLAGYSPEGHTESDKTEVMQLLQGAGDWLLGSRVLCCHWLCAVWPHAKVLN